jgi:3-oxoacyl-[acyl-carrier-protein] synthase II
VSLSVAARFLKLGHADVVVAGAVEELSMPRLIGDRLTRDRGERRLAPLGEGCVLMLLQPSPDDVGAAFLGARYGSAATATATATASASASASVSVNDQRVLLGELITELLNSHNLTGTDIDLVSLSQCASARLGEAERRAVESALDGRSARTVAVPELVGETYSAASAFQVAAALALGEKYSVVTVLGPGGEAAAALLRHGNVKAGL